MIKAGKLIKVHVTTGARRDQIFLENDIYIVRTTTFPEKGAANKKVVELVAKELRVAKSRLSITKGEKSRDKIIEIVQ